MDVEARRNFAGTIVNAQVKKYFTCNNCGSRLCEPEVEEPEAMGNTVIVCHSCNSSSLKRKLPMFLSAAVMVADNDNVFPCRRFHCSLTVLSSVLRTVGYNNADEITELCQSKIAEVLLLLPELNFQIDAQHNEITSMTIRGL